MIVKWKEYDNAHVDGIDMEKDFYIPTADLIAELEQRRPDCNNCETLSIYGMAPCRRCLWREQESLHNNFNTVKEKQK